MLIPSSLRVFIRDVLPPQALNPYLLLNGMAANGATAFDYQLQINERGQYTIGPAYVRLVGRWGFAEAQQKFPLTTQCKVLPESLAPSHALQKSALDEQRLLDQPIEVRRRGEGTEFESLAEFRAGDDPRRIDWRSSARQRRMIVRRYQLEQHRDVLILLDTGRLMGSDTGNGTKLDRAVDAALLLARAALDHGDRCGVGVFDHKVRGYIPPIGGTAAFRAITESLYAISSQWLESNFAEMFATLETRHMKRSLVIVLSDVTDVETTERYRAALMALVRKHVVLFVAIKTPQLSELLEAPVKDARDAAQAATVLRLLRERELTLLNIERSGVQVLDCEPANITVPLLNQYIAIRAANVL
jgi:uncharacterized protein (DUF58 family)